MTLVLDTSILHNVSRSLQDMHHKAERLARTASTSPLGEGYSRLKGLDTTGVSLGWGVKGLDSSSASVLDSLAQTLAGMHSNIEALREGVEVTDSEYAAAFASLDSSGSTTAGAQIHASGYQGVRSGVLHKIPLVIPIPVSFEALVAEMSTTRYPDPPATNALLKNIAAGLSEITTGLYQARHSLVSTGHGEAVDAAAAALGRLATTTSVFQSNVSALRNNMAALYGAQWGEGLPAMIARYKILDDDAKILRPDLYPMIHTALATAYQAQATALLLPAQPVISVLTLPSPGGSGASFISGGSVPPPAEAVPTIVDRLPWPAEQRRDITSSIQEISRSVPSSEGLVQQMMGYSPTQLTTTPETLDAHTSPTTSVSRFAMTAASAVAQAAHTAFSPQVSAIPTIGTMGAPGQAGPAGSYSVALPGAPGNIETAGASVGGRSQAAPTLGPVARGVDKHESLRGASAQVASQHTGGVPSRSWFGPRTSMPLTSGLMHAATGGRFGSAGRSAAQRPAEAPGGVAPGIMRPSAGTSGAAGGLGSSGSSVRGGFGGGSSLRGGGGLAMPSLGGGMPGAQGGQGGSSGFGAHAGVGQSNGGLHPGGARAGAAGDRGGMMAGPMGAAMGGGGRGSRGEGTKAVTSKVEREGNMKALLGEATPTIPGVIGEWVFTRPEDR